MEGVEDIPGSALAEGIDWKWERFPEYLDALEAKKRVIDVGVHVPHAAGARLRARRALQHRLRAQRGRDRRDGRAGARGRRRRRAGLLHLAHPAAQGPEGRAHARHLRRLRRDAGARPGDEGAEARRLRDGLRPPRRRRRVDVGQGLRQRDRPAGDPGGDLGRRLRGRQDVQHRRGGAARRAWTSARRSPGGRPASCRACTSSFHVFAGHPTYRREIAHLPLDGEGRRRCSGRRSAPRCWPRRAPSATADASAEPDELLFRVFPLGDEPELRAGPRAERRRHGRGGRRHADGDDVRPADPRRRARAVLPAAGRLLDLQLRLLPQEHAAPERAVRPLRRRRPLRRDRRRRHADLHPHPLGARPHEGRAVPARVPGPQADQRHRQGLRPARPRPAEAGPAGRHQRHRFRRACGSTGPRRSTTCRPAGGAWCSAPTAIATRSSPAR